MTNGPWIAEREALPGTSDGETGIVCDGEGGRLLAAALTAALLEYRRQVQNPDGDAEAAGPAVEWRLFTRWEQMALSARGRGRGRA
jgi:hypothetical protein